MPRGGTRTSRETYVTAATNTNLRELLLVQKLFREPFFDRLPMRCGAWSPSGDRDYIIRLDLGDRITKSTMTNIWDNRKILQHFFIIAVTTLAFRNRNFIFYRLKFELKTLSVNLDLHALIVQFHLRKNYPC